MNAIFTGRKRRGKTTLAFDMAIKAGGGIIIFDPKREFRNWPNTTGNVGDVERMIEDGAHIIIYHPAEDSDRAFSELATLVLRLHTIAMQSNWDKLGKHFTLIVDESQQLQNSWRINNELKLILSQCRPEILNVFQTMQSPTDAYRTTKVCNSDWFIFQTTHIADINRIEAFAGEEVGTIIANLGEERSYVHFSEDTSDYEIVTNSASWKRSLEYNPKEDSMAKDDDEKTGWKELIEFLEEAGFQRKKKEQADDDEPEGRVLTLRLPAKKKAS